MMNMNMTDYQQQLIDSGEAVEFPVTIRANVRRIQASLRNRQGHPPRPWGGT